VQYLRQILYEILPTKLGVNLQTSIDKGFVKKGEAYGRERIQEES